MRWPRWQKSDGPVDFVLLDGWKELYLPVLKLLEPRLSPGTLVVADNTSMAELAALLGLRPGSGQRLRERQLPGAGSDSMEISCRA